MPSEQHAPQPAHVAAAKRDWPAYYERMEGKPPRATLLKALERFDAKALLDDSRPRVAVDLGCGAGVDTAFLLSRGWRVLATDAHEEGIERLLARPDCIAASDRLEARVESFEDASIPDCDLLNASFSLPFCPPSSFPTLWAKIVRAIRVGGRFSGQFFGDRDEWAILEDRSHQTRDEVIRLFDGFILESLEEEERDNDKPGEAHKHWHVFHIVARKR